MGYSDEVLADSPVAYWRLGEKAGATTAVDETGNGNDGEYRGDPTLGVTGATAEDTAVDFDGSGDYVALDHFYSSSGVLSALTAECWFKTSVSGVDHLGLIGYDGSEYFRADIDSSDVVQFYTTDNGGTTDGFLGATNVVDGEWHHIVCVYDGTDKVIYVDGAEDARSSNPHGGSALGTGTTRYGFLGDDSEATSFDGSRNGIYIEGTLDEPAVYETALSATRIEVHYNAGIASADTVGRLLLDGLTLAASGGTVPAKDLGDQWGQYAWGVDTWGTATDAPDPVYGDPVVGRITVGPASIPEAPFPTTQQRERVEYLLLNTGVDVTPITDQSEYALLNVGVVTTQQRELSDYLLLNTTVNAEAVVGRLKLGGGTQEVFFVGYTVGSAVLTDSITASGQDAHLTWDETPTGTRVDFEVFRRSPSTGERFDPVADAVESEDTLLDFETGDTSRWDTVNELSAATDRVHSGSYAGYSNEASSSAPLAATVPDGLSGGAQITKFEYWWQETSSGSTGGGVRLVNSNGDVELGLATDNPEWDIDDANGVEANIKGDDDNYDRWVRFTVTFDWANGTFDYDFEDPTSGTTRSGTGRPLKQGVNVETVQLENYNAGVWQPDHPVEMWWDDILVEYPGPDARIAQGIDALEYTDVDPPTGDYDWQVFARVERD